MMTYETLMAQLKDADQLTPVRYRVRLSGEWSQWHETPLKYAEDAFIGACEAMETSDDMIEWEVA